MEEDKWALPAACEAEGKISDAQEHSWRKHGFALVDNLLPMELLQRCADQLNAKYAGEAGEEARKRKDFGGNEFPFNDELEGLNALTLHPNILATVKRLLQTEDVRLTQSDAWAKYGAEVSGAYDNQNQRMHIDGWNHMLVAPPAWYEPASVAIIVYLSKVEETGGGTAVVSRNGDEDPAYSEFAWLNTPGGEGSLEWINDRDSAEKYLSERDPLVHEFRKQLYAREKLAKFNFGTCLLYRHDIWHRGTPLIPGAMRLVVNLSYRREDCDWFNNWNPGWSRSMYTKSQTLERLVAQATVPQRNALGFPAPGAKYWTRSTLEAVTRRYKVFGFDPQPYANKLSP